MRPRLHNSSDQARAEAGRGADRRGLRGPEPEEDSLPPGPGKRAEEKAKAAQEAQAAVDAAEKAAAEKEAAKKAAEAPPPAPAPAEEAPAAEAPAPAPAPVKEDVEMTDAPPAAAA